VWCPVARVIACRAFVQPAQGGNGGATQDRLAEMHSELEPAQAAPLSDEQVGNIVFNEPRSLSGPGIDAARGDVAGTIMNADETWGSLRSLHADTAPPSLPSNLSPAEAQTLTRRSPVSPAGGQVWTKDFTPPYDLPSRLTGAVGPNLPYGATADCSNGYCYDALGNMTQKEEPDLLLLRRHPPAPGDGDVGRGGLYHLQPRRQRQPHREAEPIAPLLGSSLDKGLYTAVRLSGTAHRRRWSQSPVRSRGRLLQRLLL